MLQTIAKEYKELITLVYYFINTVLTILGFAAGTIYLWHRNRRDEERRAKEDREHQERREQENREYQKRREQENREYQERREQENREYQERREQENRERQDRRDEEERRDHLRREWRQFTEMIFKDHSSLKRNQILEKISIVKIRFDDIRIHSEVTGLDVLRYCLADDDYQNVWSKSPKLRAFREDLHTIYWPLSSCSTLIHLGEVPKNTKEELRGVVEELGNAAKPFLTGNKLKVALTCLEHFGGGKPYAGPERKVPDKPLEDIVPYVNSLILFCNISGSIVDTKDYCQCSRISHMGPWIGNVQYLSLSQLHENLEIKEYRSYYYTCLEEFKVQQLKSPLKLTDPIVRKDRVDELEAKVLHEIRYIHYLYTKQESSKIDRKIVSILDQLSEKITKSLPYGRKSPFPY